MATAAMDKPNATDTRQRLIDVAVSLFTRHSFAGTSLQMIADELGFTKAAIYHHFRSREQLLGAVLDPILAELRAVVEAAETRRTPHARADHMLSGYADVAVRNRALVAVLASDPSVISALQQRPDCRDLIARQLRLLADVETGPAGEIKAAMVFAGMAGAVGPMGVDTDDDSLRAHLMDASRRALGLRAKNSRLRQERND